MDPFRELGRTLLMLGGLLVLVGAFFYFGGKLPFRLGRLPGDIVHKGEHTHSLFSDCHVPVAERGFELVFLAAVALPAMKQRWRGSVMLR